MAIGTASVLIGTLGWALAGGILPPIGEWRGLALGWLQGIPLWAFAAAFVILPAFGFPILAFARRELSTNLVGVRRLTRIALTTSSTGAEDRPTDRIGSMEVSRALDHQR